MDPLDPLELPRSGLQLIEASAGTGKTFTLALLYLRLLLETPLGVEQILVVTFTQAATEELRDRIRRQLRAALQLLEGGNPTEPHQPAPPLARLLDRLPDAEGAKLRLRDALTRLDEAAIHTIHGFCQRMLQEYAFESGVPFDAELTGDDQVLAREILADFWRRAIAPLDLEEARWVRARFDAPDKLLAAIGTIITVDPIELIPAPSAEGLAAARERVGRLYQSLQGTWTRERDGVVSLLEGHPGINRRSYTRPVVAKAIGALDDLTHQFSPEGLARPEIGRFLPQTLAQATKAGAEPPRHPLFDLVEALRQAVALEDDLRRAQLLGAARSYLRQELERRKAERHLMAYDDLLRHLDQALSGPQRGEPLSHRIRTRFPAALIDEFQDTDPLQYRIFQRIYRGRPECALFLIGDPKQAIYGFRGADIFTYLQARRDLVAEGAEHNLTINWRASSPLIKATNCLFQRDGPPPFVYPDIPFVPVGAGPEADQEPLSLGGEPTPPLEIWLLTPSEGKSLPVETAGEQAAAACARRILSLLNPSIEGRARIGERPLRAGDIAVLVRTHREGDLIQRALRAVRIPSASRSRQSVFSTQEASDLALLLGAIAGSSHEGLVRAALLSDWIGMSAAKLEALTQDELAWEAELERFRTYRELWLESGILVALVRLLQQYRVPERLLARPDGERRLTNLLHLGELLGLTARDPRHTEGLLRWLAECRDSARVEESAELRLESDADLVQIITQHRSKGLEFPVVLIPFPWSHPPGEKNPILTFRGAERAMPCAYLGESERARYLPLALEQQLAEQLRLLYVSLTRSKKLTVLYWGAVRGAEDSALAYLLHPPQGGGALRSPPLQATEIGRDLASLEQRSAGSIRVQGLTDVTPEPAGYPPQAPTPLSAPAFTARIDRGWRVVSYSGLVTGQEVESPDPDALRVTREPTPSGEALEPAFQFPRGIAAGHCLHELLERIDFPTATPATLEPLAEELLGRYGLEGSWSGAAVQLVLATLHTPLDPSGSLRLREIQRQDRLSELEFHYPIDHLTPADLQGALAGFQGYQAHRGGLTFQPARGLMRGFIDLVFRQEGRFFLADYKSNHLGEHLSDYENQALRGVMGAHRYHLQSLIYSLALHRYLRQRLRDYDYDRHFGGSYYLFLRGLRPELGHRFGVCFDRPERALIEHLDRLFGGHGG